MRDFLRSLALLFAIAAVAFFALWLAAQWSPTVGRWVVFVPLVLVWVVCGGGGA